MVAGILPPDRTLHGCTGFTLPRGVDVPPALFVALFQKEQVLGHGIGDTSSGGENGGGKGLR